MRLHTNDRQLIAFQDGTLPERKRVRLANHLADCADCRILLQGQRQLRSALRREPPAPPSRVLVRALESRAAGEAVVLPPATLLSPNDATGRREDSGWHWQMPRGLGSSVLRIGALSGSIAAIALLVASLASGTPILTGEGSAIAERWREFAVGLDPLRLGEVGGVDLSFKPGHAKPAVFNAGKLVPRTAHYTEQVKDGDKEYDRPGYTVRVSKVEGPVYAWRVEVEESWLGTTRLGAERGSEELLWSEFVGDQLKLTRWGSNNRIWSTESPASSRYDVRTTTVNFLIGNRLYFSRTDAGRRPPDRWAQRGPNAGQRELSHLTPEPMFRSTRDLSVLLGTADLKPGWAGSTIAAWHAFREVEVDERVSWHITGSELVTVPAGTFDCWLVEQYPSDYTREVRAIRKSDGLLIRVYRSTFSARGEYTQTTELTSVSYP